MKTLEVTLEVLETRELSTVAAVVSSCGSGYLGNDDPALSGGSCCCSSCSV